MRRAPLLLVTLAALGPVAGVAADEGAPLRLTLAPGQVVRLVVDQTEEMTRDSTVVRSKTQQQTFAVARADDVGGARCLSVTIERSVVTVRRPGRPDEVQDSATPEGRAGPAGSLVDRPTVVRFDPRGELQGAEVLLGTPKDEVPPADRDALAPTFTEGIIRNAVLGLLTPFPEEPVEVGSAWSVRSVVGDIAIVVTNTVTEVGADAVVIAQVGRVDGPPLDGQPPRSTIEGRLVVSRADGLVAESEATMTMEAGSGAGRLVARSTWKRRRVE